MPLSIGGFTPCATPICRAHTLAPPPPPPNLLCLSLLEAEQSKKALQKYCRKRGYVNLTKQLGLARMYNGLQSVDTIYLVYYYRESWQTCRYISTCCVLSGKTTSSEGTGDFFLVPEVVSTKVSAL